MTRPPLFACLIFISACSPAPQNNHLPVTDGAAGAVDLSAATDGAAQGDLAMSPCGHCGGATPLCDTGTKKCVGCLGDGDCGEGFVCKMGACMPGCSAQHNVCGDAGACDVDLGACHGCLGDQDCNDPNMPFCEVQSGRCLACDPKNDRCALGSYCGTGGNGKATCLPGCKADAECQNKDGGGASSTCCSHACTDINTDANNCSACGTVCKKGGPCCGAKCVYLVEDVNNCGACGNVCPSKNDVPSCINGVCGSAGCKMGYGDCNGKPQDGCEVALASDTNNCGACGKACSVANGQGLCLNGNCAIGSCNNGFRDCNGDFTDGCEVNVQADPNNCGTCGQSCAMLPHATAGCMNGSCSIGSCAIGFGDCDKVGNNGCEADFSKDAANCGACGKACPTPPNMLATCNNSMCGVSGCLPGYYDCDNNLANGCEVNAANDPKNCGGCGKACPGLANAVAGCAMGGCGLGNCNTGFADCDNNPVNGCEVNTQTDSNNCGGCGKVCPNGVTCGNGVCGAACMRIGWKLGNANWACPMGYRMPTTLEWNAVAPCVTQQDNTMFGTMADVAVSVGGCNCKWNGSWCGQPSIETIRQGRMCGDYQQLQICVR